MSTTLEKLKPDSLVAFSAREKELQKIVAENPYIEVEDFRTYEEAKKRRTSLRTGRTIIQNEVKMICSELAGLSRGVKDQGDKLIEIVKPHEDKQQEPITAYEEKKEQEHLEKIRQEEERKRLIQLRIESWMNEMDSLIRNAQEIVELETAKGAMNVFLPTEEEYQEFLPNAVMAKTQADLKIANRENAIKVQEQARELERQKLENERINAELKRVEREAAREAELRAERERQEGSEVHIEVQKIAEKVIMKDKAKELQRIDTEYPVTPVEAFPEPTCECIQNSDKEKALEMIGIPYDPFVPADDFEAVPEGYLTPELTVIVQQYFTEWNELKDHYINLIQKS